MRIATPVLCAISLLYPAFADEGTAPLLAIKRLYVDRLSGGETALQMRDMIIGSLMNAKLFALTENQERADTIMRGSSEDLVFTEEHHISDSINGQVHGGKGPSRGAAASSTGASVGESETSSMSERKHEASAAVRLVNKDGDVIWSTTQESHGAKFRGSSADVADKITRRLIDDIQKARELARTKSR